MLDGLNENMIDSKGALQIIGATGTAVTTTPTWKEIGVPLTGSLTLPQRRNSCAVSEAYAPNGREPRFAPTW